MRADGVASSREGGAHEEPQCESRIDGPAAREEVAPAAAFDDVRPFADAASPATAGSQAART